MVTDPRFIPGERRAGATQSAYSLAERGPRVLTPEAMDVIELRPVWKDSGKCV